MILKVLFSEPNICNFNIKQVILNSLVAQNFDNAVFVFYVLLIRRRRF